MGRKAKRREVSSVLRVIGGDMVWKGSDQRVHEARKKCI